MSIGFFDSGIGGLTVLHEALKMMPDEDYIYFADTDNVPYGGKSKEEVRTYVFNAAEFIAGKGVSAIVIACNTATSVVIEDLRKMLDIPVIGMEPAVKPAVEMNGLRHKRVLVFATQLTLKEEKFLNLVHRLDDEGLIDSLPMPGLVEFAEKREFNSLKVIEYLKERLSGLCLSNYGTVVLGCTHFIYFKDVLKQLLPEGIELIDGNRGTVKNLMNKMKERGLSTSGSGIVEFFESGRAVLSKSCINSYFSLMSTLD